MLHVFDGTVLLPSSAPWEIFERDPISITEQAFLSKEQQIARFIRSGERLQAARREEFEYPDGDVPDDVVPDPTQRVGFDLADASALSAQLAAKAQAAKRVAKGETAASVSPSAAPSTDQKELFTDTEA